jgi:hypothetical protein
VVSIADWGNKRASRPDYGWKLNEQHRAEKKATVSGRDEV